MELTDIDVLAPAGDEAQELALLIHKCALKHLAAGVDVGGLESLSRIAKNVQSVLHKTKPQSSRYTYTEPKKKSPFELIAEEQDRWESIQKDKAERNAYREKVRQEADPIANNVIPLKLPCTDKALALKALRNQSHGAKIDHIRSTLHY